jgi:hypothetical protein
MDPATFQAIVQGGFAGLVAIFVWQSFRREERMAGRMDVIEDRSLDVISKNTEAIAKLTATLENRPCIVGRRKSE